VLSFGHLPDGPQVLVSWRVLCPQPSVDFGLVLASCCKAMDDLSGGRNITELDMVIAIVAIKSSSEKREKTRRALLASGPDSGGKGCTSCQLCQEVPDSGVLQSNPDG
jgi:hypothetical protein